MQRQLAPVSTARPKQRSREMMLGWRLLPRRRHRTGHESERSWIPRQPKQITSCLCRRSLSNSIDQIRTTHYSGEAFRCETVITSLSLLELVDFWCSTGRKCTRRVLSSTAPPYKTLGGQCLWRELCYQAPGFVVPPYETRILKEAVIDTSQSPPCFTRGPFKRASLRLLVSRNWCSASSQVSKQRA